MIPTQHKHDFFTGDVYSARFTPGALLPAVFLKVPDAAKQ
jgi:hypothetical protein